MRIAVDIDDTLNVVDRVTRAQAYIARKGLPFVLKNPRAGAFVETFDWAWEDVTAFMREGGITVFTDAEARTGAREALQTLIDEGHEIVILTARIKEWFGNPEKLSRDWLEKRRIPYHSLVAEVWEKGEYCKEHAIDVLVDDNLEICRKAQRLGVGTVLAVGRHNAACAQEFRYGGANWQQIYGAIKLIEAAGH